MDDDRFANAAFNYDNPWATFVADKRTLSGNVEKTTLNYEVVLAFCVNQVGLEALFWFCARLFFFNKKFF